MRTTDAARKALRRHLEVRSSPRPRMRTTDAARKAPRRHLEVRSSPKPRMRTTSATRKPPHHHLEVRSSPRPRMRTTGAARKALRRLKASICSTRSMRTAPARTDVCSLPWYLFTGCLLTVCFTACLLAGVACAQEAREPFSHATFRGGLATNIRHNASYAHWRRGYGPLFAATTPFYAGEIEAGVALHRYAAALRNTPSFYAWFTFVGWGVRYASPGSFSWYGGVRTGMYHLIFDEEPGDEEEKEFSLALVSRLDLHLSPNLRLFVEGHVMRTYTLPRFHTGGLTGGIGLRIRNPAWLRTFLE